MIKIDINETKVIQLWQINENKPIFAKRDGKFVGMVVSEGIDRWILRTGGRKGCDGHHNTLVKCLKSATKYRFEFFIEETD